MNVYELALKYFPLLWDEKRIKALYDADKLTSEEYESIINKGDAEK